MDQQDVVRIFETERLKARRRMMIVGGCIGALVLFIIGLNVWNQVNHPLTDTEFETRASELISKSDLSGFTDLIQSQLDRPNRDFAGLASTIAAGTKQFGANRVSFPFSKVISDEKDDFRGTEMARLLVSAETANLLASDATATLAGFGKTAMADLSDAIKLIPTARLSGDEMAEGEWAEAEAGRSPTLPTDPPKPSSITAVQPDPDGVAFHICALAKLGTTPERLEDINASELVQPLAAIAVALAEHEAGKDDRALAMANQAKILRDSGSLSQNLADVLQQKQDDMAKTIQAESASAANHVKEIFDDSSLTEATFWAAVASHMAPKYETSYDGKLDVPPTTKETLAASGYPSNVQASVVVTQDEVVPTFGSTSDRSNDQLDQTLVATFGVAGSATAEVMPFKIHWRRVGNEFLIDRLDSKITQYDPNSLTKPPASSTPAPSP